MDTHNREKVDTLVTILAVFWLATMAILVTVAYQPAIPRCPPTVHTSYDCRVTDTSLGLPFTKCVDREGRALSSCVDEWQHCVPECPARSR